MKQPNILFILTDQWRGKSTGFDLDPNVKTPHLDKLAKESVEFANAISVCPVCTPARSAMITGRFPTSTGMMLNDIMLPLHERCMGDIFREQGYDTAYIGKWHLDGHGRATRVAPERRRGFEFWKGQECAHNYTYSRYYEGDDPNVKVWDGYDAFDQTKAVKRYLRERGTDSDGGAANPFLLFLSYGPPHFPHHKAPEEYQDWYPPESLQLPPNFDVEQECYRFEGPHGLLPITGKVGDGYQLKDTETGFSGPLRKEMQGYYGHCSALDWCVGELMAELRNTGLDRNTIVVFTSDHGDGLGANGVPAQIKWFPWDEEVRVPCLIRDPRFEGRHGQRCDTPINTPDLLPTLMGMAGMDVLESVEGRDLSALIRGEEEEMDHVALYMLPLPFEGGMDCPAYRGIRTATHTYVESVDGPWLLYDDKKDPYQMENLVRMPEHEGVLNKLRDRLRRELNAINDPFKEPSHYIEEWQLPVLPEFNNVVTSNPMAELESPAATPVRKGVTV